MTGTVRKLDENNAYVVVRRQSACGENCGNCSGCKDKSNEIVAKNSVGAMPGQSVVVEMESKKVLMAAFLFYMVPLLLFFGIYAVLHLLELTEISCIILGVCVALIFYILLYFYDKKQKSKYQHEIIKITDN